MTSLTIGYSASWPTVYIPLAALRTVTTIDEQVIDTKFKLLRLQVAASQAICQSSLGFFLSLLDFKDIDPSIERFVNETYIVGDHVKAQLDCYESFFNMTSGEVLPKGNISSPLDYICAQLSTQITQIAQRIRASCPKLSQPILEPDPHAIDEYVTLDALAKVNTKIGIAEGMVQNFFESDYFCNQLIPLPTASMISHRYNCPVGSRLKPKQDCRPLEKENSLSTELCKEWLNRSLLLSIIDHRKASQEWEEPS